MKKFYLSLILCAVAHNFALAQIPNAGFETWNSMGSYNEPDQWGTMNSVTSGLSVYTCTKGTPGNPGSSYLKLVSKNVSGMGVVPGVAGTGSLNLMNQTASGFAFSSRPQNLTGSWQYMPSTGDTGIASVLLCKWNSILNKRDTIAFAVKNLSGMVMSWTSFSIPLTYLNGSNPDTCVIIFSSSKSTPVANSYVYVDNLNFSGTVAGINSQEKELGITLYPNPASTHLVIESSVIAKAEILDIAGKICRQIELHFSKNTVDITTLTPGIYFVKMANGEKISVQKFIKQ